MELAKEIFQTIGGLATVVVAVLGIFISFMTLRLTKQQNKENREAAKQQLEANRQEARSNRFTRAIDHMKDESLHIRMGALYELQRLG